MVINPYSLYADFLVQSARVQDGLQSQGINRVFDQTTELVKSRSWSQKNIAKYMTVHLAQSRSNRRPPLDLPEHPERGRESRVDGVDQPPSRYSFQGPSSPVTTYISVDLGSYKLVITWNTVRKGAERDSAGLQRPNLVNNYPGQKGHSGVERGYEVRAVVVYDDHGNFFCGGEALNKFDGELAEALLPGTKYHRLDNLKPLLDRWSSRANLVGNMEERDKVRDQLDRMVERDIITDHFQPVRDMLEYVFAHAKQYIHERDPAFDNVDVRIGFAVLPGAATADIRLCQQLIMSAANKVSLGRACPDRSVFITDESIASATAILQDHLREPVCSMDSYHIRKKTNHDSPRVAF
jgi:hypothetical protein